MFHLRNTKVQLCLAAQVCVALRCQHAPRSPKQSREQIKECQSTVKARFLLFFFSSQLVVVGEVARLILDRQPLVVSPQVLEAHD